MTASMPERWISPRARICTVHNLFGKLYLFFVVPLDRYGVQKLMASALAARRL